VRIGLIIPQNEIGTDPGAMRAFAVAAEEAGFAHLVVFDHVVGRSADPDDYAGREWHEPFVLFGFLAAATQRIELTTGIVILPQRQTALAAKQAAQVDILSGGRLRLGLGVGWNEEEYEALGQPFRRRGRRLDAQMPVLRRLLEQPSLDLALEHEVFRGVGLNPLPGRRIPLWLGGWGEAAVRRAVTWGDGLILNTHGDYAGEREAYEATRDALHAAADAHGRPREELGIEVWLDTEERGPDAWRREVDAWRDAGASHLSLFVTEAERLTPTQLVERVAPIAAAVLS
jgi:probable F420-dependent oxidoreductase